MKNDLISRSALKEILSTLTMTITGLRAGKGVLSEFMTEYRKSVLRIVDDARAVDAVPVVRCKDCGYYRSKGKFCMGIPTEPPVFRSPDDFCSRGRRRGEG